MERKTGYLDIVRVIACILVVGVHVSALNLGDLPVTSLNFKIMNGFDCISILGVPLFVMISGSLLLDGNREIGLKKWYLQKTLKLLVLYFGCLIFYNIVNVIDANEVWNFTTVKSKIIVNSLYGYGIYHLWFLRMLFMMYVVTPFIKPFAQNKRLCELFVIFYFVIKILIPTTFLVEYPGKAIIETWYNQFPEMIFTDYVGYYVFGYYVHRHMKPLTKVQKLLVAVGAIISMLAEIMICNYDSVKTGSYSTIVNNPLMVFCFITAISLFVLFSQINIDRRPYLVKLGGLSLGIYLIHPFVLSRSSMIGVNTLFAPSIISVPIVIAGVTLVSGLLVFGIKYLFVVIQHF